MKAGKPYILIAEDDEEDQYLLSVAFRESQLPASFQFVNTGLEILHYFENNDLHSFPDLIVLDLNMPMLNGIETLNRLKTNSQYRQIPVIVYSTSVNESEKSKCLDMGAAEFVQKPNSFYQTLLMAEYFYKFCVTIKQSV